MKRHCVFGEDRHVGSIEIGLIHRAYFNDVKTGRIGSGCPDGCASAWAEVSGDGIFNIGTLE